MLERGTVLRAPSGNPQTTQHSIHLAPQTYSQHHSAPPEWGDQLINPTTTPDYPHALSACGTLCLQPDNATRQCAHDLQRLQIPKHRAGPGEAGAGQAAGAPRSQPRRRHPKTPSTNTQTRLARHPSKTDPLDYERRELPATAPDSRARQNPSTQIPEHRNPVAPESPIRAPEPESQHSKTRWHQHRASPGQRTRSRRTHSSL